MARDLRTTTDLGSIAVVADIATASLAARAD
jgi:hypothetical protein